MKKILFFNSEERKKESSIVICLSCNLRESLRRKAVMNFGAIFSSYCGVCVFVTPVILTLRDIDTMIEGEGQCRKLTKSERFQPNLAVGNLIDTSDESRWYRSGHHPQKHLQRFVRVPSIGRHYVRGILSSWSRYSICYKHLFFHSQYGQEYQ